MPGSNDTLKGVCTSRAGACRGTSTGAEGCASGAGCWAPAWNDTIAAMTPAHTETWSFIA